MKSKYFVILKGSGVDKYFEEKAHKSLAKAKVEKTRLSKMNPREKLYIMEIKPAKGEL